MSHTLGDLEHTVIWSLLHINKDFSENSYNVSVLKKKEFHTESIFENISAQTKSENDLKTQRENDIFKNIHILYVWTRPYCFL